MEAKTLGYLWPILSSCSMATLLSYTQLILPNLPKLLQTKVSDCPDQAMYRIALSPRMS